MLAEAVPELQSAAQLPTVHGAQRFAVVAPDGRTVLVSLDSPDAVGRFRQLAAVPAIGTGVAELLAAGVSGSTGFIVQPMPEPLPGWQSGLAPDRLRALLEPVVAALIALHAAGLCVGSLSLDSLALQADGTANLADLLTAVPIGARVAPGDWPRYAGAVPSAPEIADGQPLTAATDSFALAAMIATLLTGSSGWLGNPAAALSALGAEGRDTVLGALAIEPAGRRGTPQDLLQALTDVAGAAPPRPASRPVVEASRPVARPAPAAPQPGRSTLPPPPPVRSRQPVAAADVPAAVREVPAWQRQLSDAAVEMWGPADEFAEPIDRPDLRFRPAVELTQLAVTPDRPAWRSPVVIGSVVLTAVVLVIALVLMLG